ncbi:MAG: flagellar export chaperone FlgN [Thermoleophilia bacterium]|nr:flagellar export chaperone FlgN [Thermoleophilia bacterium]
MSAQIVDVVTEVVANVREQVRIWSRLLELSSAQREALEVQDVHRVHAVLQEIEVTMLDRGRTEVRRGMLLQQAASILGLELAAVTRDVLVGCVGAELGQELEAAAEELRALVVELDAVVARNTALLEQELAIIEVLVQGATTDVAARTTYGKQGVQQEAPRLRLLDAQA